VPPSQVSDAAKELGALEQITLVCLEKKPEDRFGSMRDLADALDRVVRVRDGGELEIAARLDMPPNRASVDVRYRMADELEPPTLEEMRVAIDSGPSARGQRLSWRWFVAGGGALLALVLAVWILPDREPRERTPNLAASTEMPLPADPKTIFLGGLFALALLAAAYVARCAMQPTASRFIPEKYLSGRTGSVSWGYRIWVVFITPGR